MALVPYVPFQLEARQGDGEAEAGAKLWFFLYDTTTPVTVYQTPSGTAHTHPVVADADGAWPAIYWESETRTRVKKTGSAALNANDPDWQVLDIGTTAATAGKLNTDLSNPGTPSDEDAEAFRSSIGAARVADYPSIMDVIPAEYHADIRDGTSTEDVTGYLDDATAAYDTFYLPVGRYVVGMWEIPAGKTILTAGRGTEFKALAGHSILEPMIRITGSGVSFGSCSLTGNINTDTNEFRHGLQVANAAAAINDVRIGDLYGTDIRGDVLNILAWLGFPVTNVVYGLVEGDNILRNVVAIVGGKQIKGAWMSGSQVGYAIFDIEPEIFTEPCENIRADGVSGGVVQIAGAEAASYSRNVYIGGLYLDPTLQANSSPVYSGYDVANGFRIRNIINVQVGHLRANGYTGSPVSHIFNPGELAVQSLTVDFLEGSSTAEHFIAGENLSNVTINGGAVTGLGNSKAVVVGSSAAPGTSIRKIKDLTADGSIAHYAANSRFDNCSSNNAAASAYLTVSHSVINGGTYNTSVLGAGCSFCTVEPLYSQTFASAVFSAFGADPNHLKHTILDPNCAWLQGSVTYDPGSLADGAGVTTTVTVPGCKPGDFAIPSFSNSVSGMTVTAWAEDGLASVRFQNESGGTLDLASGTLRVKVTK